MKIDKLAYAFFIFFLINRFKYIITGAGIRVWNWGHWPIPTEPRVTNIEIWQAVTEYQRNDNIYSIDDKTPLQSV